MERDFLFEFHGDLDPELPVIFNEDFRKIGSGRDYVLHWHEEIEIIYCDEGSGVVVAGLETVAMKEGEMVIVNSGMLHTVSTQGYCHYYYLMPDNDLFRLHMPGPKGALFKPQISDGRIIALAKGIIAEMTDKGEHYKPLVYGLLLQMLSLLLRDHSIRGEERGAYREDNRTIMVKDAMLYIREHFSRPLTVDELCGVVGYSKYYFCHAFKEISGYSVVEYITLLRCQNARYLLMGGKYNVSECAARCGFNSVSYFAKRYRQCYGVLPSRHNPGRARGEGKG